jgi:hypothetical protein
LISELKWLLATTTHTYEFVSTDANPAVGCGLDTKEVRFLYANDKTIAGAHFLRLIEPRIVAPV